MLTLILLFVLIPLTFLISYVFYLKRKNNFLETQIQKEYELKKYWKLRNTNIEEVDVVCSINYNNKKFFYEKNDFLTLMKSFNSRFGHKISSGYRRDCKDEEIKEVLEHFNFNFNDEKLHESLEDANVERNEKLIKMMK